LSEAGLASDAAEAGGKADGPFSLVVMELEAMAHDGFGLHPQHSPVPRDKEKAGREGMGRNALLLMPGATSSQSLLLGAVSVVLRQTRKNLHHHHQQQQQQQQHVQQQQQKKLLVLFLRLRTRKSSKFCSSHGHYCSC
ncbi:hypothetical protein CLOM_g1669, partial [Closterium sp. NIES-68]